MRALVFTEERHATLETPIGAAVEGARRLGHEPYLAGKNTRFEPGNPEFEGFDYVMTNGYRGRTPMMVEHFKARNIPVFLVDLGYLNRSRAGWNKGYYQFSLWGLNWIPPHPCKHDRVDVLDLDYEPAERRGDYILILGQVPSDAGHNLGGVVYRQWLEDTKKTIEANTDRPVRIRHHPQYMEQTVPLKEDLDGAWATVTYNSTASFEAMLRGLPIFCDPGCHYAEIANTSLTKTKLQRPWKPGRQKLRDFLARVAYAQWRLAELKTGAPIRWALNKTGYLNE